MHCSGRSPDRFERRLRAKIHGLEGREAVVGMQPVRRNAAVAFSPHAEHGAGKKARQQRKVERPRTRDPPVSSKRRSTYR